MFILTEINFIIFSNWQAFIDFSTEGFQIPPQGEKIKLKVKQSKFLSAVL